jgi:hypothetical protein
VAEGDQAYSDPTPEVKAARIQAGPSYNLGQMFVINGANSLNALERGALALKQDVRLYIVKEGDKTQKRALFYIAAPGKYHYAKEKHDAYCRRLTEMKCLYCGESGHYVLNKERTAVTCPRLQGKVTTARNNEGDRFWTNSEPVVASIHL